MTKHEADSVRKFARHLDDFGLKGFTFCTLAERWIHTQADEPNPAGDMGPLEMATMQELIDELGKRSINAAIYVEREGKDNDYHLQFCGDPLRLHGIINLRMGPELIQWYAGRTRTAGEDNQP